MATNIVSKEDIPNSLSLFPSLCIICGGEIVVEVKAEIGVDDECRIVDKDPQLGSPQTYAKDVNTGGQGQLLQFFFKLFRLQEDEDWKLWRCESRGNQKSFCHLCQQRIEILEALQKKLEELKEQLENGRKEVKRAMVSSEESLQKVGIYKRDKIFYRIRCEILGNGHKTFHKSKSEIELDPLPLMAAKLATENNSRRHSSRGAAKKAKEKILASAIEKDPFVMLSATDRDYAEKKKIQTLAEVGNQNAWEMDECEKSGWVTPHSDLDEIDADMEVNSDVSNEQDSAPKSVKNLAKKTVKTKQQHVPKITGRGRPKKIKLNQNEAHPKHEGVVKRKSRLKAETEDDDDFIPPVEEAHWGESSSASEEEVDSDYDESKLGKGKYKKQFKYEIDETTGNYNYTALNITMEKLPKSNLGKEQYKCTKCSRNLIMPIHRQFPTEHYLGTHMRRQHSGRYKCTKCYRELGSAQALSLHLERVHRQSIVHCPICEKPFTLARVMRKHKLSHLSEEERQQLNIRTKNRLAFQCEECGFPAATHQSLREHRIRRHGTAEEKATLRKLTLCPECGKCIGADKLKVHMDSVHGTTWNFPCVLCDKRFKTKGALRNHKRIHEDERPFKCVMCPKAFHKQKALTDHMNTHLNIRPFKCEFCPSAFNRKDHLRNHHSIFHEEGSNPRRPTYVRGPPKQFTQGKNSPDERDNSYQ